MNFQQQPPTHVQTDTHLGNILQAAHSDLGQPAWVKRKGEKTSNLTFAAYSC